MYPQQTPIDGKENASVRFSIKTELQTPRSERPRGLRLRPETPAAPPNTPATVDLDQSSLKNSAICLPPLPLFPFERPEEPISPLHTRSKECFALYALPERSTSDVSNLINANRVTLSPGPLQSDSVDSGGITDIPSAWESGLPRRKHSVTILIFLV